MSNEHYHALDGISGTNLSLLKESNKHLDNKKNFKLDETEALKFGTLLHTVVLEPDQVDSVYAISEKFNKTTNIGKEGFSKFKEENPGKIIIDEVVYAKAQKMARNVHSVFGDIIDSGIKERSLFVDIDKLILKCRLDIDLQDVGDDYDIKTITLGNKSFSDIVLERHLESMNYHQSAAFRNIIRRALGAPVRHSYLIFCETGSGNMVKCKQINPDVIAEQEYHVGEMLQERRFYLNDGIDNKPTVIGRVSRNY